MVKLNIKLVNIKKQIHWAAYLDQYLFITVPVKKNKFTNKNLSDKDYSYLVLIRILKQFGLIN